MAQQYDVIIVGAGAAGLSAALYATRRQLKTLILSRDFGGQTATTMDIENYPGVDFSTGPDLMNAFAAQAKKFGAEVKLGVVTQITKRGDGDFLVTTQGGDLTARAVILAFGKYHRELGVAGEEEFKNKGVVYCATCDAPLFADKDVVVVGGGSAAFDAALLLTKIAKKIYLVHRRDQFKAEGILVERAQQDPKIEFILNSQIKEIRGDNFVREVALDTPTGERILAVEGVFVEVGSIVGSEFVKELVELSSAGEIVIDNVNQTSVEGVFAAGDATTVPFKQTVISAGEGAKAALAAYNYIQGADPHRAMADQGYIK